MRMKYFALFTIIFTNLQTRFELLEKSGESITLRSFFLTLGFITIIIVGFMVFLNRIMSHQEVLRIRKLSIIAGLTIAINAIIFGIFYLKV